MKQLFPLRRLFHLSGCLIPVVYLLTNKRVALLVAAAAIVAVAFIEALRIKGCIRLGFVEALLKERELKGPTGSLFYLVSCLATILFFDKRIASASIFVLAVSDPISSIVGLKWGRRSFRGKSAEGTAAFFFSSVLVLACFSFKWPGIIVAAAAACATELFSSKYVDDNLAIPIVAALALAALAR